MSGGVPDPLVAGPFAGRPPGLDLRSVAVHEIAHALYGKFAGVEIATVSIREGARHAGVTITIGRDIDPSALSFLPWYINPDLAPVVRSLHHLLAGDVAEALAFGTGRVAAPDADAAQAAFDALPEANRTGLLNAEASTDGQSDRARAWALAVAFCGPSARLLYELAYQDLRRDVSQRMCTIESLASELLITSVLDGVAFDTILSVGQPVDGEGPPTSGRWTAITTCFIADVEEPARVGESLPWHDRRVQCVPELFLPTSSPPDVIRRAIDDYRKASMSPEPVGSRRLEPGPGVVRCVRRFVGRTRNGGSITVARGDLARADAWYVRRWTDKFEPSVVEDRADTKQGKP
jgi:hypothetical protein